MEQLSKKTTQSETEPMGVGRGDTQPLQTVPVHSEPFILT